MSHPPFSDTLSGDRKGGFLQESSPSRQERFFQRAEGCGLPEIRRSMAPARRESTAVPARDGWAVPAGPTRNRAVQSSFRFARTVRLDRRPVLPPLSRESSGEYPARAFSWGLLGIASGAEIRARSETQIEDEFRPIFGNRFFSIQGYHSVEPKSCSQATLEYPRDRKEVVLKDTHDDIGRHMQNPRSKCMRMSSRISTRTFGNHFPAPRSVRPKVAAISGIAFPNLLTPEFAGLRANDNRRAFFRLLAKEHLAKSCAQLVNLTSCGRLHVFPVPLHFAHGSMPGSVLRSGIIGIGRHTLKW